MNPRLRRGAAGSTRQISITDALHRANGGIESGDDAAAFRADNKISEHKQTRHIRFAGGIKDGAVFIF
jgi:hypothetical protein